MLCIVVSAFADERNIDFDSHTDFSALKTFALRDGRVNSPRPELNNSLMVRKIGDAIRAELLAKRLKESANNPDLWVDYAISSEDFAAQRGGPATFSQGTLVIDLIKRDTKTLVWRGVYRDDESNNTKLAQKFPADARKIISEYPPRQKGPVEPAGATVPASKDITPKAASAAALEIVHATLEDKSFAGGANHPGLAVALNNLQRWAQAIVDDDGRSPAATEDRISRFRKAMQETIDFAATVAGRTGETPDARAKSRDLGEKLRSLLGP
jgi:hypothetical protein